MYQRLKPRALRGDLRGVFTRLLHVPRLKGMHLSICLMLLTPPLVFAPAAQAAQGSEPIDLEWQGASPQQRLRVDQAVNTYHLLDSYVDKTFRGKRPFTRYELAEAIGRLQGIIHQRYQVPVAVEPRMAAALQVYFQPSGDIPTRHWATPMILQSLSTGVLQGEQTYRELHFKGLQTLSQAELEAACFRVLDWLQIAPKEPLSHLGIVPFGADSRARQTPASRYDLAISLVNTLHYIEEAAKTRSLLPKVVIPMPVPARDIPTRIDGRRLPTQYLPRQLMP